MPYTIHLSSHPANSRLNLTTTRPVSCTQRRGADGLGYTKQPSKTENLESHWLSVRRAVVKHVASNVNPMPPQDRVQRLLKTPSSVLYFFVQQMQLRKCKRGRMSASAWRIWVCDLTVNPQGGFRLCRDSLGQREKAHRYKRLHELQEPGNATLSVKEDHRCRVNGTYSQCRSCR